MPNCTART